MTDVYMSEIRSSGSKSSSGELGLLLGGLQDQDIEYR